MMSDEQAKLALYKEVQTIIGFDGAQYFHGGAPGIAVGEEILPPDQTKVRPFSPRPDRVFIITDFFHSMLYAAMHPSNRGTVYVVKPIGELEDDPDCKKPDMSFMCEKAIVLKEVIVPPKMMQAAKAVVRSVPAKQW